MSILNIPEDINFLLVDDVASIRALVRGELISLGFKGKIVEAENGYLAFNYLDTSYTTPNKVDYIISDLVMPVMTGHHLLEEVRGDQRFKDLPFLMLTTESEKDLVVQSIKLGVSNFLLKPFISADFQKKLKQCWLKHHS
jgi:two-component system chemotaxis response regulator CheY